MKMFQLLILLLCLHAKYGYLRRVDWKNEVPMMMNEEDSVHSQVNLKGYGSYQEDSVHSSANSKGYSGFRPLNQFAYRIAQQYHSESYDRCDKYSSNYDPHHPDCSKDKCVKTSINYMPNHPECADKCDPNSITYTPNQCPCDPNSINFMPNNPDCVVDPDPCPTPDPCNPECPNFDPCNQLCNPDPCNENCPTFDKCNESCPNFDKCDPDCNDLAVCDPDCDIFDKCDANCDPDECDEECADFDPCNENCSQNNPKCTEGCDQFDRCDEECTEADKTGCDGDRCGDDPCNSDCPEFDPTDPRCEPVPQPPKCQVLLSSINTTACQISEEFQAMTCGECPDADIDIEELTDACRKPSADLIDCMATIGTMEDDSGRLCNMYEFKFLRSTMSPKCFKPKVKHPVYPKPEPRYIKRYIPHRSKLGYTKHYQAPKKLFYKPRKMSVIVRKRYF